MGGTSRTRARPSVHSASNKPFLMQFEPRQLCVLRSFRRQLALIQKEVAGGHGTKLVRGKGCEFFLQALEGPIGPVVALPVGRCGAAWTASQCQMRAVSSVFFGDSESCGSIVNRAGERCQFGRFDADPKHAR